MFHFYAGKNKTFLFTFKISRLTICLKLYKCRNILSVKSVFENVQMAKNQREFILKAKVVLENLQNAKKVNTIRSVYV